MIPAGNVVFFVSYKEDGRHKRHIGTGWRDMTHRRHQVLEEGREASGLMTAPEAEADTIMDNLIAAMKRNTHALH
jgi:hypothetical protein